MTLAPVLAASFDTSFDRILSSATVGGTLTAVALALLFFCQLVYWRPALVAPGVRRLVVGLAFQSCVFVVMFISARFLIID